MSDQPTPPERPEPADDRDGPFLFRLLRTTIAPPVLKDGGHDAPLSARGRIIFSTIVAVLVVAITILLVASLHR